MTEQEFRDIYPPEVIELMFQRQEEHGNPRNIQPFLKDIMTGTISGGFNWIRTIEGWDFWDKVLTYKEFAVFYKQYPKKELKNILLLL
jgi:hypothetical protein